MKDRYRDDRLNLFFIVGLTSANSRSFLGNRNGFSWVVDRRKRYTVIGAYNLNWKTLQPVKEKLKKLLGILLLSTMMQMSRHWGTTGWSWRKSAWCCFYDLRTGVGGGIVAEGKLLHGVAGATGELGHITVDLISQFMYCGKKGCLETVASATGIVNLTQNRYADEYAGEAE